eukprot:CAMPEP_0174921636 /NCGR_PEP_ID=MMETSP1355-20121228/5294_1 /TAXON_ID=464990 /ORGANISM="Hemiselmis tepida, Strain CCMP443" /LENGTH=146 /DNA_ID=CAMNT_0016167147 /DNA_START=126 /DNA_END=563 /DNA_ORIENTATION=+
MGHLGARHGAKPVVAASLALMAVGYLLYAMSSTRWMLVTARFLMGWGAGNVSVLRYYASGATADRHRTHLMAKLSGAQSLGFVLGPGIGYALAVLLKGKSYDVVPPYVLHIDMYTAPGVFASAACIANALVVWWYVVELQEDPPAK